MQEKKNESRANVVGRMMFHPHIGLTGKAPLAFGLLILGLETGRVA